MAANTRKEAAKKFAVYWAGQRGSEKGEDQTFWNSLLSEVLGVSDVKSRIRYQDPVHYKGTTKFLDAWIPETQVLIEHKSRGVDLDAPQAHHDGQTPFQQAWDYDNNRPRREKARWIVVTNFDEIRIHDMEADVPETTFETILLKDLAKEVHRLDFLVKEVESIREKEARVSIEAGRVVGKLYNAFLEQVGEGAKDPKILRDLNILCVRLVFCVYAEDAGVFEKDAFLKFLRQFKPASFHLQLRELFKVLAQRPEERGGFLAPELKAFPYVGGGLFRDETDIPVFSDKVARILLDEASEHFDWSEISPTIFGAVFESTLNPETRRKGGMHYTSEENIHKVIDPLFLDDFRAGFAAIKEKPAGKARDRELEAFQQKLGGLTFLDPACGSGNFLTETYISLRKLENEALALRFRGQGQFDLEDRKLVHVSINQFYGIEINDFAVTVAQTAMWIAECKMMEDTNRILSKNFTPLPLTDSAKIVEGNALRMDWEGLLSNSDESECSANAPRHFDYIMGNPPFIGYSNQSVEQKNDMLSLYVDEKGKPYKTAGKIDYVAGWYWKAAALMRDADIRAAFVSTNSITQGEQVAAVWKPLKDRFCLDIDFAWKTFVWDSEALDKAHVHVVIIGFHAARPYPPSEASSEGGAMRGESVPYRSAAGDGRANTPGSPQKLIFDEKGNRYVAKHINGYLMDGPDVWVESRTKPFCDVPNLMSGNRPTDGGYLILEPQERKDILRHDPGAGAFVKKFVMGYEFINNIERYCLWLVNASPKDIREHAEIAKRVSLCRDARLSSPDKSRVRLADTPHLFREQINPAHFVAIPKVSSQRRLYIPCGYLDADTIAGDKIFMIPDGELWHFGVLMSSVHMAWMRVVCGRLKSDYSYSINIVYNNFPWPKAARPESAPYRSGVGDGRANTPGSPQSEIEKAAQGILDARAKYPDSSLADLYDPLTMPSELRKAHATNDAAVMKAYGFPPDLTEPEIVSRLFEMYAKLTKGDK